MPQEELPPSCLRLFSGRSPTGSLIGVECLERQDAGVEGAVLAPIAACRAVPAAVVELLAEQVADNVVKALGVVSVSSGEPHQDRDDAGLRTRHRLCHSQRRSHPAKAAGCRGGGPSQTRCRRVYVVEVHLGE